MKKLLFLLIPLFVFVYIAYIWNNNSNKVSDIETVSCGDILTDERDGNAYSTIQIGTQCWMAENLAYLPSVVDSKTGVVDVTGDSRGTTPYYYVYDYEGTDVAAAKATSNYQTYGTLYNWAAVNQGSICPTGWSVPSDEEFKTLEMYLGMTSLDANNTGWRTSGDVGTKLRDSDTNSSGFNALLGGTREATGGSFENLGVVTLFWSSTSDDWNAWRRYLNSSFTGVSRSVSGQDHGFSVRCLRD